MNYRLYKLFLFLSISSILFANCKKNSKEYSQGVLTYKIKYLDDRIKNPIIEFLPKTIKIKFKNNKSAIIVNGFFNTFQFRFITNYEKKVSYTALTIFDKKYYAQTPIDSLSAGYENFNKMNIKYKNDTMRIGGLLSYEADVICKNLSDSVIKVYYTNQLNLKKPNAGSPYKDISGVLTRFQTKLAGINMIFELKNFQYQEINDQVFEISKDYKKVSKKQLNKIIKSFRH
jgi:hypothetical protein